MPIAEDKEEFIAYALDKVYFYIESNFWSKISIQQLNLWFSNFESLDERYLAAKLLDRFVYYSEDDTIRLIKYGLIELIFKEVQVKFEAENDFRSSEAELNDLWDKFLQETAILPLGLGATASSNLIARHFCQELYFPEENVLTCSDLDSNYLRKFRRIIIVDDFLGSGDQIIEFWNTTEGSLDGSPVKMFELKSKFKEIEILYLCLVATEDGIANFYSEDLFHDKSLRIIHCETLKEKYKVFGKNSVYFEEDELHENKLVLEEMCRRKGMTMDGWRGHNYAIAFHHCIPDNSLPLFYEQSDEWNFLIRNKKTKVVDELQ